MSLELRVAQAVYGARLVERALHDEGPWEVQVFDIKVPATKVVGEDCVSFEYALPAICPIDGVGIEAMLLCNGEFVSMMVIPSHLFDGQRLAWAIEVGDPVAS